MFYIDPLYLMLLLPCLAFAGAASFFVKSTFGRYSKVRSRSGLTGAEAARRMLERNGVFHVGIEETRGFLTDHYDPAARKLRLSPEVFRGDSLSAVGVACHEAGHALQHAESYAPLWLRTALVPVTNASSHLAIWVFLAGLLFQARPLLAAGCGMFAVAVVFALVTLPVEWNASARAKGQLTAAGIVSPDQAAGAGRVLNAAFLTYVAAAATALATLLYYLLRSGLLGGRRDD